jgi:hypothetical protein
MKVRLERLAPVEYRRPVFSVLSCAVAILCLRRLRFRIVVYPREQPVGFSATEVVRSYGDVLYADMPLTPTHKFGYELDILQHPS